MKPRFNFFTICAGFLISLFCIFCINVKNTSASNINGLTEHKITFGRIYSSTSSRQCDATINTNQGATFGCSSSQFLGGWVDNLTLNLSTSIPANSVFYITGYYYKNMDSTSNFQGLQTSPDLLILDSQVTNISGNGTGSAGDSGVQYSYLIYNKYARDTLVFGNVNMFHFAGGTNIFTVSNIVSGWFTTDPDSQQIDTVINSLEDIKSQMRQIVQNSQNQAINEMNQRDEERKEQEDEDRDNIEQQSSDAQDSADSASQQINSASQSLLIVIGNFVNIIINPPASNCVIDADMGHMDLGNIDLCQLTPPEPIQIIATLLIIGFIIPFVYSLIQTFINLLRGATQ